MQFSVRIYDDSSSPLDSCHMVLYSIVDLHVALSCVIPVKRGYRGVNSTIAVCIVFSACDFQVW